MDSGVAGNDKIIEKFFQVTASTNFKLKNDREKSYLIHGNNMVVMENLLKAGFAGKFSLIYLDPPFFSGRDYNWKGTSGNTRIFNDFTGSERADYLKFLEIRLQKMKDLLSPEGTIFVHLDWHIVHHVKLLMDTLFGSENFRNEIVWHYFLGGKSKRFFARKHDTILFYSRSDKWKFHSMKVKRRLDYVPGLPVRSSSGKETEDTTGKDNAGWYSVVTADDVWDIPGVFNLSSEYTGYPTQKPIALLKRIVSAATDPGDLVGDFFCGSGTTLEAALEEGRSWIGSDISPVALNTSFLRLINNKNSEKQRIVLLSCTKGESEEDWNSIREIISDKINVLFNPDNRHFKSDSPKRSFLIMKPGESFPADIDSEKMEDTFQQEDTKITVISGRWNFPLNSGFESIMSDYGNASAVNIPYFPVEDGNSDVLTQSCELHELRNLKFMLETNKMKIGKFSMSQIEDNGNDKINFSLEDIKLWLLDLNYNGIEFRPDLASNSQKKSEIEIKGFSALEGKKIASMIFYGNSGRIFTILDI